MEKFLENIQDPRYLMAWGLFVIAGSIHEWGHAYSAYKLGDSTAKDMGRMSFNPLVHIDLVGTVLLPLFIPSGWIFIGWMKPVPCNPMNLQNGSRDSAIISWGGPFMNFIQAGLAGLILVLIKIFFPDILYSISNNKVEASVIYLLFQSYIGTNVLLAFFNLLPVPPLDGGGIIRHFLPQKGKEVIDSVANYGILIILLFLFMVPKLPTFLQYPYVFINLFWDQVKMNNLLFFSLYFLVIVTNILLFRKIYKKIMPGSRKNLKKKIDKYQDEFSLTQKKNRKLYKLAISFFQAGDVAALNDILPPLKVKEANICEAEEYKPEDDYCQKCDWFANCLDRKLVSMSKREK